MAEVAGIPIAAILAIACLQPIYDRFTEGFDTADLIAGKQHLSELGDACSR